ncbi:MAG: DUF6106 family protein [Clostridia bacterium]|nr:DUF6106 family protein [Clostridia bacterium]
MDTFFEQIVAIKKTGKSLLLITGIWFLAFAVSMLVFIFLFSSTFSFLAILLIFGAFYGAYKLSGRLSVEYEYIITNGTMDVDKIIAKSSRKRDASFELADVERLEKYNKNAKPVGNYEKTVIACNEDDPSAYFIVVSKEGKGKLLLVFTPNERIKEAMVKFIPKFISNSAFKD